MAVSVRLAPDVMPPSSPQLVQSVSRAHCREGKLGVAREIVDDSRLAIVEMFVIIKLLPEVVPQSESEAETVAWQRPQIRSKAASKSPCPVPSEHCLFTVGSRPGPKLGALAGESHGAREPAMDYFVVKYESATTTYVDDDEDDSTIASAAAAAAATTTITYHHYSYSFAYPSSYPY